MKKILFLLKKSSNYHVDNYDTGKLKSGLYNSARLVAEALSEFKGIETKLELCIDGNDVDNKLFKYKPNICIIEAIWITPTKLKELQKLHPNIDFVVRIHSKIPFLAMEGVAIDWIKQYMLIKNVKVAFNNKKTHSDLNFIELQNTYLPNIYEKINKSKKCIFKKTTNRNKTKSVYDISCFGAIRPLKNQLNQAVAAIKFGDMNNSVVNFYVNSSRLEQSGENVLKNLRALFADTNHNLIEVEWLCRKDFLELLSKMDVSMQVSLTETFNIVAADSVLVKVPVVISKEIDWLSTGIADPNDVCSMVKQIYYVLNHKNNIICENNNSLAKYNKKAIFEWKKFILD